MVSPFWFNLLPTTTTKYSYADMLPLNDFIFEVLSLSVQPVKSTAIAVGLYNSTQSFPAPGFAKNSLITTFGTETESVILK